MVLVDIEGGREVGREGRKEGREGGRLIPSMHLLGLLPVSDITFHSLPPSLSPYLPGKLGTKGGETRRRAVSPRPSEDVPSRRGREGGREGGKEGEREGGRVSKRRDRKGKTKKGEKRREGKTEELYEP